LDVDRDELRAVVAELAGLSRPSGSDGEAEAARRLAERLRERGCHVRLEEERVHPDPWRGLALLSALAAGAGVAALRGRRVLGAALGVAVAACLTDEIEGGPHAFRRLCQRRGTTFNVVAEAGDRDAERTLVVHAHHDAAHSGLIFDQAGQRLAWERFPQVIAATDTSLPVWFPVVGAPLAIATGVLLRRRAMVRAGLVVAVGATAFLADVAVRDAVPGANDNLSGVAALVALASALRADPVRGLRVLLVSAGCEESLQEGIRAFGRRHFGSLPRERTWFLNLDTIGSHHELVPLEAEGPLVLRDYDRAFTDFVCDCAAETGAPLRRGSRSRTSTDGCTPQRAGYPTATLVSLTPWKSLENYHWPSDVPENVDYDMVARATKIAERVVRRLAESS
jgi:acetylornithine deacetylase/succinyl-diaminopimelate desuccinylase-like protein